MEKDQKLSEMLGIKKEDIEHQKDLLPVFNLSKVAVGGMVFIQILSEPQKVSWIDKDTDEQKEGSIINIVVEKVRQLDGVTVDFGDKYALWLTSKTLAMGMIRLAENDNPKTLLGKRAIIKVGTAVYKKGENRCYSVSEL